MNMSIGRALYLLKILPLLINILSPMTMMSTIPLKRRKMTKVRGEALRRGEDQLIDFHHHGDENPRTLPDSSSAKRRQLHGPQAKAREPVSRTISITDARQVLAVMAPNVMLPLTPVLGVPAQGGRSLLPEPRVLQELLLQLQTLGEIEHVSASNRVRFASNESKG